MKTETTNTMHLTGGPEGFGYMCIGRVVGNGKVHDTI